MDVKILKDEASSIAGVESQSVAAVIAARVRPLTSMARLLHQR